MKSSNERTWINRMPFDACWRVLMTLDRTCGADFGCVASVKSVVRDSPVRAQRFPFFGSRIHSG